MPAPLPPLPDTLAAIDLGSNSFHLIVARPRPGGQFQVIDRLREMVRLGEGLNPDRSLLPEVADRALGCLERFGQRLRDMPPGSVRAVGTNTLRQVRAGDAFLARAEQALGHPIAVIAGREEARLIYLGVAHGLAAGRERRLVVDIGGGSTELIIGRHFTPGLRESLHMGCVSATGRHFSDGVISSQAMSRAELYAALEVRPVRELFRATGWDRVVGSSGTIRAIRDLVVAEGWCDDGISAAALERLSRALVEQGHSDRLDFRSLSAERRPVFAGGVAVLRGVFTSLGLERMGVSDEALREGLLYEMMGRVRRGDVRERTVSTMMRRHRVDRPHALRVEATALDLFARAREPWGLDDGEHQALLRWAARLHEAGLAVAHSQYQKHGAYLLLNADMSGFSRREQALLSTLVRGHRRKFPAAEFEALPADTRQPVRRLCVLLRLAVLLHRSRSSEVKPALELTVAGETLNVGFPDGWLDTHPLTRAELDEEAGRLAAAGLELRLD
jgi:exopolyphosphatase/guanosine-5'-triphosphate,3'-diphosphate pyrophosphatase